MGIYLGQLPPAEIARLKAELAETIIANFCYPRFYDYRTNSLRMRPVDRAKRQEVWLFLSAVDFTTWGRVDLMSQDFPRQIERLFIQFVQRNRSFFGEQGRKRMPDVRALISSSATLVAQGLRGHLSGQRQNTAPFGSPRPVVTWSAAPANGRAELTWEQIANATLLLQQQLQEARGEVKPASPNDGRALPLPPQRTPLPRTANETEATPPQTRRPEPAGNHKMATTPPLSGPKSTAPLGPTPARPAASSTPPRRSEVPPAQYAPAATMPATASPIAAKGAEPSEAAQSRARLARSANPQAAVMPPPTQAPESNGATRPGPMPTRVMPEQEPKSAPLPPAPPVPVQARPLPQTVASTQLATGNLSSSIAPSPTTALRMGEDDLAIFEEIRTQLIVWLRVEAIRRGIELTGQTPPELLELLRQEGHLDDTRLQVVSTLLNLANQVLKSGQVSVLDYKQALMFHLMHTRHWK
jgi:hypothetical protein